MALASTFNELGIGLESTLGDVGAVPTRKIITDGTITPVRNINNVTDRLDGSRAEDYQRYPTSELVNISFSGQFYYELNPLFTGMFIAGGNHLVKAILDQVTDGTANKGTAANPNSPRQRSPVCKFSFSS